MNRTTGARPMTGGWKLEELAFLIEELSKLRDAQLKNASLLREEIAEMPEANRPSARNLMHYLAFRRHDLRPLQMNLATLGISSLGRSEGHVLHNVTSVLKLLHHLIRHSWQVPEGSEDILTGEEGFQLLTSRTQALLGPLPGPRAVRVMVTMPSEAARDGRLIRELLARGMNCMRINCAHDGPREWESMVDHLRRAQEELGAPCRILMDLAGPKIRTGPLAPGPRVLSWRPTRDEFGNPTKPARIWLTPSEGPETPPEPADATLPLPRAWLAGLQTGDVVCFRDARRARRELRIVGTSADSRWGESSDTCYVTPGLPFWTGRERGSFTLVGPLPSLDQKLKLRRGDRLILTKDPAPGGAAEGNQPARISCTLPEALEDVKLGERVWFDDGKIGGAIRDVLPDGIEVEITHARPGGERLAADKGINFPDSDLRTPALTEKDVRDLEFVAKHADLVGCSFVREAAEVRALQDRLRALGRADLGIVLKIETRRAFENLPNLLLAALRGPLAGVMIARGDLAVECGYERLAEVQEEILWLCEAAHLPVIWATQVLEHMTKDGIPSRAEVTDAAMGERAECVMLNKGPYLPDAVQMLDGILRRMETHQSKKTPTLRPLRVAGGGLATRG